MFFFCLCWSTNLQYVNNQKRHAVNTINSLHCVTHNKNKSPRSRPPVVIIRQNTCIVDLNPLVPVYWINPPTMTLLHRTALFTIIWRVTKNYSNLCVSEQHINQRFAQCNTLYIYIFRIRWVRSTNMSTACGTDAQDSEPYILFARITQNTIRNVWANSNTRHLTKRTPHN